MTSSSSSSGGSGSGSRAPCAAAAAAAAASRRLALLLLSAAAGGAAAAEDLGGSLGSAPAAHDGGDIERRIVLSLAALGVALFALSLCMMVAAGSPGNDSEHVEMRDHQSGAVGALTGWDKLSIDDKRGLREKREMLEKRAFKEAAPNESAEPAEHIEQQHEIDEFFLGTVNDNWLMRQLEDVAYPVGDGDGQKPFVRIPQDRCPSCVGWKACWCRSAHGAKGAHRNQEAEYLELRGRLRKYVRARLFIRGGLEPSHRKPAAEAAKRLTKSAVSLFDFVSDILACQQMYLRIEQLDLAVAAMVWLVISTSFTAIGVFYFVFLAKEAGPTSRRLVDERLFEKSFLAYFLVFLPALTNAELLHHMPWWNRKALEEFNGLPSVRCALFCAIAAIFEDIPQLTIQLLFTHRTTGIQNFHELDWQLKLSIGMGSASLLFRVLLRCFIALEKKCHQEQPQSQPQQAPLRPLYLGFSRAPDTVNERTHPGGHRPDDGRFQPANHPLLRQQGWQMFWRNPGEQIACAGGGPDAQPEPDLGSFLYRDRNGATFRFDNTGATGNPEGHSQFPDGLGPLRIHRLPEQWNSREHGLQLATAAAAAAAGNHQTQTERLLGQDDRWSWELPVHRFTSLDTNALQELYPSGTVQGQMTEPHEINYEPDNRKRARIPVHATHFQWAYPPDLIIDRLLSDDDDLKKQFDTESPEYLFLTVGGFVYSSKQGDGPSIIKGVNALGAIDSAKPLGLGAGDWELQVTLQGPVFGTASPGQRGRVITVYINPDEQLAKLRRKVADQFALDLESDDCELLLRLDGSSDPLPAKWSDWTLKKCGLTTGCEVLASYQQDELPPIPPVGDSFKEDRGKEEDPIVIPASFEELLERLGLEHQPDELLHKAPETIEMMLEFRLPRALGAKRNQNKRNQNEPSRSFLLGASFLVLVPSLSW
jgi:hypothetical protein